MKTTNSALLMAVLASLLTLTRNGSRLKQDGLAIDARFGSHKCK